MGQIIVPIFFWTAKKISVENKIGLKEKNAIGEEEKNSEQI